MDNNFNNLTNSELINIIKNLQCENKKIKIDLRTIEILKNNHEKGEEIEINYRKEIFNIIKEDIYMQNIIGPKPTSSNKNDIKFCIKEIYNLCKLLELFMKNNNIKNRLEFMEIFKNNKIMLCNNNNTLHSLYKKYNIKNHIELEIIVKKHNNTNINNYQNESLEDNINFVTESIKDIKIEEEKEDIKNYKIQCIYIPVKGKNKNIKCNKYANNETKYSDNPLCSVHKKCKNVINSQK